MIIERVKLENIRSYTSADVSLGQGVTLLAGDIGAGKSTILLAIEFALFGIRTGELSGDALLRHGEKQGSVTLTFRIDRTYTIQRTLKRTSRGVRQDSGFLAVGDEHEDLSAQELKARILNILGYPEELLTKRKGFVFRYTVYTPQEEMKQILLEDDASRLDTLRSVFGVDKYRAVADNAQSLAKALRDDKRYLKGRLDALAGLEDARDALQEKERVLIDELTDRNARVKQAAQAVAQAEQTGARLDTQHEQAVKRQQVLAGLQAKKQGITERLQEVSRKLLTVEHRLGQQHQQIEDPSDALEQVASKRAEVVEKRAKARAQLATIQERLNALSEEAADIDSLEQCPRCKQPVTPEHRSHIQEGLTEQRATLKHKAERASVIAEKAEHILEQLEEKRRSLQTRKKLHEAYREFAQAKQRAETEQKELKQAQKALQERYDAVRKEESELQEVDFDEQAYRRYKTTLKQRQEELKTQENAQAAANAKLESVRERLAENQQGLEQKAAAKQRLARIAGRERWLSQSFIPTTGVIEQHVLAAIHQEFNRLFTQWFSTLIEDDSMYAELSAGFSPLVTQNGYDADIPHLSGGERTSVALAYRLALTTVVNSLLRHLRTADLLILDEPTDGFSSEQLDRVRTVLDELDCRQVIVVSHEQKMESYVDRVVRVAKLHGVSEVA